MGFGSTKPVRAVLEMPKELLLMTLNHDWNNKFLNSDERYFHKTYLAFLRSSDGIVNENLAEKFLY